MTERAPSPVLRLTLVQPTSLNDVVKWADIAAVSLTAHTYLAQVPFTQEDE